MSAKDFQVLSKLGEGSYSSVWKVIRLSDNKEYAMKKVKMNALNDKEKENALNEVRILASIQSPYIIGYKEAFFDDNSMTLCIVMEFAASGDLYNRIQQHIKNRTYFPEKEIWQCFIQILKALKTLHAKKILHRDLKCANVFLDVEGSAKLGDLNVSKVAKNNLVYTQTGTPYYASPEVWKDQPYDAKSDIWSLGCVIYEMAALKPPFRATDMQGLYKKVTQGKFDRIPTQYSADLANVISLCLQTSPTQRPSSDQLLKNPIVLKYASDANSVVVEPTIADPLLNTIKVPKNMRALGQQLPKSNYNQLKSIKEEKEPKQSSKQTRPMTTIEKEQPSPNVQNSHVPNNKPIERVQSADIKSRPLPVNNNYYSPSYGGAEKPTTVVKKELIADRSKNEVRETENEYLLRMQREYLERAKAYSPNIFSKNAQPQNQANSQQPNIPGRSQIPTSNVVSSNNNPPSKPPMNNPQYNYNNIFRQDVKQDNIKPYSREIGSHVHERPMSHKPEGYGVKEQVAPQSRPISNYHNRNNYYEDPKMDLRIAYDAKKVEYVSKNQSPVYQQPTYSQKKAEESELLQKYNNIYNLKQQYDRIQPYAMKRESPIIPSGKVSSNLYNYGGNGEHYYNKPTTKDKSPITQVNNVSHAKQQQQMYYKQGVVRPGWWG